MHRTPLVTVLLALAAVTILTPTAGADKSSLPERYQDVYEQVDREDAGPYPGGVAGRNLADDGVRTASGERPATEAELREGISIMERMLAPPAPAPSTVPGAGAPVAAASATTATTNGSSNSMVDPSCESGGDPQVVDASGTYWGKYQFDYSTWVASGGDPAGYGSASETEQDAVASTVTYDAWPSC